MNIYNIWTLYGKCQEKNEKKLFVFHLSSSFEIWFIFYAWRASVCNDIFTLEQCDFYYFSYIYTFVSKNLWKLNCNYLIFIKNSLSSIKMMIDAKENLLFFQIYFPHLQFLAFIYSQHMKKYTFVRSCSHSIDNLPSLHTFQLWPDATPTRTWYKIHLSHYIDLYSITF